MACKDLAARVGDQQSGGGQALRQGLAHRGDVLRQPQEIECHDDAAPPAAFRCGQRDEDRQKGGGQHGFPRYIADGRHHCRVAIAEPAWHLGEAGPGSADEPAAGVINRKKDISWKARLQRGQGRCAGRLQCLHRRHLANGDAKLAGGFQDRIDIGAGNPCLARRVLTEFGYPAGAQIKLRE